MPRLIEPSERELASNWRKARAVAYGISLEHRRYLAEFGRLPSVPLHRLEVGPLLDIARAAYREPGGHLTHAGDAAALVQLCGVNRGVAHRWIREGVPRTGAERAADACGRHPADIWHDYYFDLGSDDEEVAA